MEPPPVGTTVTYERTFTVEDVQQFAALSGDDQPRHTERGEDGRVMVQGLLTASMATKLGADREVLAPGMEFEFLEPVFTGDRITCLVTYDRVEERTDRYDLTWDVRCEDEAGEVVLRGTVEGIVRKDA